MEARKLTGYALAKRMGMTPSAIYKLKTADRINLSTLALLCEALECTPGDLLEYEPAKKKRGH